MSSTTPNPVPKQIETSEQIFDRAFDQHDPDTVYVLVSGGHDSLTTLHVTYSLPNVEIDGVVHIDTGIGVPETREFVKQRCDDLGLDFIKVGSDYRLPREEYDSLVERYGFPGPAVHRWMYLNLKGKPLQRFVNEHDEDVLLVSGVRQAESTNRMENIDDTGIQEKDGALWTSPLLTWTQQDINKYRDAHDLPTNPVVNELHMSGECLCGAYADRRELEMLKIFYPDTARAIEVLELDVLDKVERGDVQEEYALWGNGTMSDGELSARLDNDQTTFELCSDCEDRCASEAYSMGGNSMTTPEALLRSEHKINNSTEYYCVPCHTVVDDAQQHRKDAHPFDTDEEDDWDMRKIATIESNIRDATITEVADDAFVHCPAGHDWTGLKRGVLACRECGAFNLSDGKVTIEDLRESTPSGGCSGNCEDCDEYQREAENTEKEELRDGAENSKPLTAFE